MLTSTLPVRFALDFLGVEEFRPGDVFVANDPYHGGGHLPDYNVFAPAFADPADDGKDGRPRLIASIQCHHGDTGGAVPGGYNVTAADIWGEGARWPVLKVVDAGVERRDVLYCLQTNNRQPGYLAARAGLLWPGRHSPHGHRRRRCPRIPTSRALCWWQHDP
jgi:N-methylhydantoinase B